MNLDHREYSRQAGFGQATMLIAAVVIGLLVFVGWRVYDSNRLLDSGSASGGRTTGVPQVITKKQPVDSSNLVRYEDKELGFKFTYPKSWGAVVAGPQYADKALLFAGTFDNNDKVTFGVAQKDYNRQEHQGDPPCYENGFGEFQPLLTGTSTNYFYAQELVKAPAKQVIVSYKTGYCAGNKLSGRVRLDLSKTNGIDITYFNQKPAASEQLVKDYMNIEANLTSDQLKKQFSDVVDSISKL